MTSLILGSQVKVTKSRMQWRRHWHDSEQQAIANMVPGTEAVDDIAQWLEPYPRSNVLRHSIGPMLMKLLATIGRTWCPEWRMIPPSALPGMWVHIAQRKPRDTDWGGQREQIGRTISNIRGCTHEHLVIHMQCTRSLIQICLEIWSLQQLILVLKAST